MPETDTLDAPAAAPVTPPAADWRTALPEDMRTLPTLKDIKTLPDVVKKLVNAEGMIGKKGLIQPSKDAPPAEWDSFYNALGRPSTADKYTMPTENVPEDVAVDPEFVKGFTAEAHRLGLNEQQFAGMARAFLNKAGEAKTAQAAQRASERQKAEGTLREKWGDAFDQNLVLAKYGLHKLGGDEAVSRATAAEWGNDPILADVLYKVGKMTKTDEVIGGGGSQSFRDTPAEAQAKVSTWLSSQDNAEPYYNEGHPAHKAKVDEYQRLYAAAYPPPKPGAI